MKSEVYTREDILAGCDREKDALMCEIGDRMLHFFGKTDGSYSFPADCPQATQILKMTTRLCMKQDAVPREEETGER